jgi:hypothetical protein
LQKKNKNLPPLSSYINRKPFFPNFVDPVPPGHRFKIPPRPIPSDVGPTQSLEISQSNIPVTPERIDEEVIVNQFVLDFDQGALLISFFDDVCPAIIYCTHGCDDPECSASTHELPSVDLLEKNLGKVPFSDVQSVYELVQTFPPEMRCRFFPAFAKIYARGKYFEKLKHLVRSCQKSPKTLSCFENIVDALLRNLQWSSYDAIKFLIDNHNDSKDARKVLVEIILSSKQDVMKFLDYLNMVNSSP